MNFGFLEALRTMDPDTVPRIAREARPPGSYIFNTLLPEVQRPDYNASSATMTIRSTMAGLVSMDSPYPPVGIIDSSDFNEKLAKIGAYVGLTEQMLREIQAFIQTVVNRGGVVTTAMVQEVLNFTNKLLVEPHLATAEWMRGRALAMGAINWTFNGKTLSVDYGIPAENIGTQRTGTASYGGSASAFWEDVRFHRRRQRSGLRALIVHPDTRDLIVDNPANNLVPVDEGPGYIDLRKIIPATGQYTQDAGDRVRLIVYDLEGEVYDQANPGKTLKVPFMPRGVLLGVGQNRSSTVYRVGAGSTDPVENNLGYTHIGPTIEGQGQMGRWSRVYVPDNAPWSLVGQSAGNLLPVIEAPEKISITTTAMTP